MSFQVLGDGTPDALSVVMFKSIMKHQKQLIITNVGVTAILGGSFLAAFIALI
jgi:hypothetical protein